MVLRDCKGQDGKRLYVRVDDLKDAEREAVYRCLEGFEKLEKISTCSSYTFFGILLVATALIQFGGWWVFETLSFMSSIALSTSSLIIGVVIGTLAGRYVRSQMLPALRLEILQLHHSANQFPRVRSVLEEYAEICEPFSRLLYVKSTGLVLDSA